MGKGEDEQSAADGRVSVEESERNAGDPCPPCRSIGRIVGLRCLAALFLGCAVLLSAVFWLPPFLGADHKGRRRSPELEGEGWGWVVLVCGIVVLWCIAGSWPGFFNLFFPNRLVVFLVILLSFVTFIYLFILFWYE